VECWITVSMCLHENSTSQHRTLCSLEFDLVLIMWLLIFPEFVSIISDPNTANPVWWINAINYKSNANNIWLEAFVATKCNKIFSCAQPHQNGATVQHFRGPLCKEDFIVTLKISGRGERIIKLHYICDKLSIEWQRQDKNGSAFSLYICILVKYFILKLCAQITWSTKIHGTLRVYSVHPSTCLTLIWKIFVCG
jgi:hypothetical protein